MLDGNAVIITVGVNGGMQQSRDGAFVPTQPVDIAGVASRCHEVGASVVHVQARDAAGRNTGDPERSMTRSFVRSEFARQS
jgi:uncharacterized protein (DUF849 family)